MFNHLSRFEIYYHFLMCVDFLSHEKVRLLFSASLFDMKFTIFPIDTTPKSDIMDTEARTLTKTK